eukprot:5017092-Heterocapsa_arctica.AAC.1
MPTSRHCMIHISASFCNLPPSAALRGLCKGARREVPSWPGITFRLRRAQSRSCAPQCLAD